MAPTGRRITFNGISVNRFADGVMVEADVVIDMLEVLEQIGGYPKT